MAIVREVLLYLSVGVVQVGVIGIGVYLQSEAMQWAGFIMLGGFGLLTLAGFIVKSVAESNKDAEKS